MDGPVLEHRHPIGLPVVDAVASDLILVLGDDQAGIEVGDMLVEIVDPAVYREDIDPGPSSSERGLPGQKTPP